MSEAKNIWLLRLLAVALAILGWFFFTVQKRERSADTVIEATLRYENVPGLVILDRVEKVEVGVQGPESKISGLNPLSVDVFVEIKEPEKEFSEIPLGPENVSLPEGLEVISIEPNVIPLNLDRRIDHLLGVKPRLEGEPAAGAVVKDPEVIPSMVLVRGPESLIAAATFLTTTPIDLTGHALDFEVQAAVISPDPLITVVQPVVRVKIPMEIPGTTPETTEAGQEPPAPGEEVSVEASAQG